MADRTCLTDHSLFHIPVSATTTRCMKCWWLFTVSERNPGFKDSSVPVKKKRVLDLASTYGSGSISEQMLREYALPTTRGTSGRV